jgi:carboxypeptidase Taq
MEDKLNALNHFMEEVLDLSNAASLLAWDQQVNMPPGGAADRGAQLATLNRLAHIKFTSDEIGQLLEALAPYAAGLDPDSDAARLIQLTERDYRLATRVPPDHVARRARLLSAARGAWVRARQAADFSIFQPHLQAIMDLNQEYVSYFAPFEHVYDPLLDQFEPGMKTREVRAIFETLRPQQVALLQAIKERPQVDDSFLHQPFEEKKQWAFGEMVISRCGYDWDRGRQDLSPHPFTTSFGLGDVRITTRVQPDFFNPAFFATLHECGHALYNQGFSPDIARTRLARGASLAIHESQSRMWENLVGRSRAFWEYFYTDLQDTFPTQLGDVAFARFYKGINKVEPSLIRVEADEATYNLHIMLRLELEIALMEGQLAVKDLPEAWNQGIQDTLGLTPPDDAVGVLQDIHWSEGLMGYFSTYALGNLVSLQLWEQIEQDIPDLPDEIRQGNFVPLLEWVREHIHRHGAKYKPQELVERVTGSCITSEPYIRYLHKKYGEIYGL